MGGGLITPAIIWRISEIEATPSKAAEVRIHLAAAKNNITNKIIPATRIHVRRASRRVSQSEKIAHAGTCLGNDAGFADGPNENTSLSLSSFRIGGALSASALGETALRISVALGPRSLETHDVNHPLVLPPSPWGTPGLARLGRLRRFAGQYRASLHYHPPSAAWQLEGILPVLQYNKLVKARKNEKTDCEGCNHALKH